MVANKTLSPLTTSVDLAHHPAAWMELFKDDADSFRLSDSELDRFFERRIFNTETMLQVMRRQLAKFRSRSTTAAAVASEDPELGAASGPGDEQDVPVIVREMMRKRENRTNDTAESGRSGAVTLDEHKKLKAKFGRLMRAQTMKYPVSSAPEIARHAGDCVSADHSQTDGVSSSEDEHIGGLEDADATRVSKSFYGTPNPLISPSEVVCGGCGSVLHCQDISVPGYIPSELFESCSKRQLYNTTCQRCTFLSNYDVALKVTVGAKDYERIISEIKEKMALVVLMVDLMDFPCSIWPGIVDLIGPKRPIVVVGNKVDLLPKDGKDYLVRARESLAQALKDSGIDRDGNVKHVCVVSAKTGYGVEELISQLQKIWATRGDIYIIGCTNVGKSSLFNALVMSDLCLTKAMDSVPRATISLWPGTTLNLLRFPINDPDPRKIYRRIKRLTALHGHLRKERKYRAYELERTSEIELATPIGHIGTTFRKDSDYPSLPQSLNHSAVDSRSTSNRRPLYLKDNELKNTKWFYDTPGVVHSDQLLSLLTLQELVFTLPKSIITSRGVVLKPGYTFFLAGLGRIDHVNGDESARLMIFSSTQLPLSVVKIEDADDFYRKYLGTPVLKVPQGSSERLRDFPHLVSKEVMLTGSHNNESCADIVLSSAGWCSVCLATGSSSQFLAYTPGGLGIYTRQPALLPHAIVLQGERIKRTPFCRPSNIAI